MYTSSIHTYIYQLRLECQSVFLSNNSSWQGGSIFILLVIRLDSFQHFVDTWYDIQISWMSLFNFHMNFLHYLLIDWFSFLFCFPFPSLWLSVCFIPNVLTVSSGQDIRGSASDTVDQGLDSFPDGVILNRPFKSAY